MMTDIRELGWRGDCPNCRDGILCALTHKWVCLKCRRSWTDEQLKAASKRVRDRRASKAQEIKHDTES
jgi:hypothetical protein